MKELLHKVPWKKVAEVTGYAVVGVLAVAKAVGDNDDKKVWDAVKKDYKENKMNSKND